METLAQGKEAAIDYSSDGRVMGKKVGVYTGSFNPVHIGHLALANYLCEYEGLDEVWFMVSPRNPFKQECELMDDALRLELVRLAVEGYPKFQASDFEFHLPRPSYTVHTLEALRQSYPAHDFHYIMGADNWASFTRWYEWKRILDENPILIYPRPGYPVQEEALPAHVRLVSSPVFEVSSTFIRQALREGKDIRYFLHPAVYRRLKDSLPLLP